VRAPMCTSGSGYLPAQEQPPAASSQQTPADTSQHPAGTASGQQWPVATSQQPTAGGQMAMGNVKSWRLVVVVGAVGHPCKLVPFPWRAAS
jgi:hypothetical protein